jgi:NADH-quinone oxidoreductase subunit N
LVIEPSYLRVLTFAGPELVLTVTAVLVLFVDLGGMRLTGRPTRRMMAAAITGLGCLAAFLWTVLSESSGVLPGGVLVVDPLTNLARQILLAVTVLTVMVSVDSDFTEHIGEYFALLLFATIGMLLMVGTENLLVIFLGLELASLSLYVLTAFNKENPASAEAGLKYFLFGGVAAAFALFGFSLLYGLTGSIQLREIAAALQGKPLDPLLAVAMVMAVIGFGFKIAGVPFHLWAPDTYQGAPAPSAALIASGSKVASFILLAKVMMIGFAGAEGSGSWRDLVAGWIPLLAAVAALSMVLGNLAALAQSSVKRLLAYSAIAHAGYALLGIVAVSERGMGALVYYAATYAITTVGAFGVVAMIESAKGDVRLDDLRGLGRRAPIPAFCLMVFVLSLAGIPPLAGFFGKFFLFATALERAPQNLGLLWLVALAIAMSAVSLYYYLQILKRVYVAPSTDDVPVIRASATLQTGLALAAIGVIVLGCVPGLLLGRLTAALMGGL